MEWVLELHIELIPLASSDKFGSGCLEHHVQRLLNLSAGLVGTRTWLISPVCSSALGLEG